MRLPKDRALPKDTELVAITLPGVEGIFKVINNSHNFNDKFYNEKTNNLIVTRNHFGSEGEMTDTPLNSITPPRFEKVVDVLNNNNNILMLVSQVWGTTSDVIIVKNANTKELKNMTVYELDKYANNRAKEQYNKPMKFMVCE